MRPLSRQIGPLTLRTAVSAISGLVARWTLDETTGLTLADTTGGHPATLMPNNGSAWTGGTLGVAGQIGKAAQFSSGYGYAGTGLSLAAAGTLTLMAWIYWDSAAGYRSIVGKRSDGASSYEWQLRLNAATPSLLLNGSAAVNASAPVIANTWTHVAVTRDAAGSVKFYTNGSAMGTFTASVFNANAAVAVGIGGVTDGISQMWSGKLDDIRVYNRVLAIAEIQAAMNGAA